MGHVMSGYHANSGRHFTGEEEEDGGGGEQAKTRRSDEDTESSSHRVRMGRGCQDRVFFTSLISSLDLFRRVTYESTPSSSEDVV